MYLKTHCLDLKPKKVLPDPLNIKDKKSKSKKNIITKTISKKIPKLKFLSTNKCILKNKKRLKKIYQIEKEIEKNEKYFFKKTKKELNNFFEKINEKKIYLKKQKIKTPKYHPLNRAQSAKKMYHEIFVEPKLIELTKINEKMRKNYLKKEKTEKEKILEKKINSIKYETSINPTYILNQKNKKSRIISAFSKENNNKSEIEKKTRIDENISIFENSKKIRQFSAFYNNSEKKENKENFQNSFYEKKPKIQRPATSTFLLTNKAEKNNKKKRFFSSYVNNEKKHRLKRLNIKSKYIPDSMNFKEIMQNVKIDKKYFNDYIVIKYKNLKEVIFEENFNYFENDKKEILCEKNNKNKILKFLNFCVIYEKKGFFKKSLYYLKKIYNSKEFKIYTKLENFVLNHLSYCFFKLKNYNSSFEILKEFLENSEQNFKGIVFFNIIICLRKLKNITVEKFYLKEYYNFTMIMNCIENHFFSTIHFFLFFLKKKQFLKAKKILDDFCENIFEENLLKEVEYFKNFLPKNLVTKKLKNDNFPKMFKNEINEEIEDEKNVNIGVENGVKNFYNFQKGFNC